MYVIMLSECIKTSITFGSHDTERSTSKNTNTFEKSSMRSLQIAWALITDVVFHMADQIKTF
jgi:hypothetical protein